MHDAGIAPLLDAIVRTVPSPAGATVQADGTGLTTDHRQHVDPSGCGVNRAGAETSVVHTPGGYASYQTIKVITGGLRSDADLICARTGAKIRLNKLSTRQGEKLKDVQELSGGTIWRR
ncbi:hypothetical protein GBAR_LOCUS18396 [Geodia barretti]|uniref:Uncharacterized protein n=1 Tax=Geodia barretti TaxID=519541 RepID=A0AA35WXM7_GEOBA|nr:hypothetical protein GBAR_LOCUS18396 [Geodia barretti]